MQAFVYLYIHADLPLPLHSCRLTLPLHSCRLTFTFTFMQAFVYLYIHADLPLPLHSCRLTLPLHSCRLTLPLHSCRLQFSLAILSPTQSFPSHLGAGSVHARTRVLFPNPHVTLHGCHGDQLPHFPFTVNRRCHLIAF